MAGNIYHACWNDQVTIMEELQRLLEKLIHSSDISVRFPHGIVHPRRDWFTALFVATLVTIALVLFNVMLFTRTNQEFASFVVGQGGATTISREELLNAVNQLEEKKRLLDVLKNTKPAIGQP